MFYLHFHTRESGKRERKREIEKERESASVHANAKPRVIANDRIEKRKSRALIWRGVPELI